MEFFLEQEQSSSISTSKGKSGREKGGLVDLGIDGKGKIRG
jgi:hypothetical protein